MARPFVIRTTNEPASSVNDGGTYYNVGLTHVEISSDGGSVITSEGYNAQRKNVFCIGKYQKL